MHHKFAVDVDFNLELIAGRIEALCGIWANCKSFLLALRRRADRVSRFEWDSESLHDDRKGLLLPGLRSSECCR
jgi:hypothetical protein